MLALTSAAVTSGLTFVDGGDGVRTLARVRVDTMLCAGVVGMLIFAHALIK